MTAVLWLFLAQGLLGAFDTVYFHEWRARLPARRKARAELVVHAIRDFLYAVLFISLPWFTWGGAWAFVLTCVILAEIILTFTDFIVEMRVRKALGDVFGGERITHAAMAIVYGAALANLIPEIVRWARGASIVSWNPVDAPGSLRVALTAMGVGVALSGLRDLYAAFGPPGASWPWPRADEARESAVPTTTGG